MSMTFYQVKHNVNKEKIVHNNKDEIVIRLEEKIKNIKKPSMTFEVKLYIMKKRSLLC